VPNSHGIGTEILSLNLKSTLHWDKGDLTPQSSKTDLNSSYKKQ
jgi:hypothetical protein